MRANDYATLNLWWMGMNIHQQSKATIEIGFSKLDVNWQYYEEIMNIQFLELYHSFVWWHWAKSY
jgi:hypothetical protein